MMMIMQTRLLFSDSKMNINFIQDYLKKKYGDMDKLSLDINKDKCQIPEKVDDYLIWKTIKNFEKEMRSLNENTTGTISKKNLYYLEEIVFFSSDFYSILTPRRVEILEYVHKKHPKSVKSLAEETKRDYKNVYDDLLAMEKFNLIEFIKVGKNKKPISRLTTLELILDQ